MIQRSIHYKSDFKLRLANEIDWSTPFKARFFTTRPVSAMEVSYDGTTYKGCRVDEEGKLVVTFDRFTQLHRQGLGNLMMELTYNIDDDQFADNSFDRILAPQKVVCTDDENNEFELVLGLNGDSNVEVECSVIAAYKKGDPGDTPEIGENGNWWIGGVDTEVKADYSSEEALRQSQEAARVAAETARANAETTRQSNEAARQSAETTRANAEATRQTNETARQSAETQRQQTFQTNEAARQTAYQNAEANRNGAYQEAEQDRDEEFASKEATRDAANQAALDCADTLAALGPEMGNIILGASKMTETVHVLNRDTSARYTFKVGKGIPIRLSGSIGTAISSRININLKKVSDNSQYLGVAIQAGNTASNAEVKAASTEDVDLYLSVYAQQDIDVTFNVENLLNVPSIKENVDALVAAGYVCAGTATKSTTPDTSAKVFYLCSEVGVYSNFNNMQVYSDELAIFKYNGTQWSKSSVVLARTRFTDKGGVKELYLLPDSGIGSMHLVYRNSSGKWYVVFYDTTAGANRVGQTKQYTSETDASGVLPIYRYNSGLTSDIVGYVVVDWASFSEGTNAFTAETYNSAKVLANSPSVAVLLQNKAFEDLVGKDVELNEITHNIPRGTTAEFTTFLCKAGVRYDLDAHLNEATASGNTNIFFKNGDTQVARLDIVSPSTNINVQSEGQYLQFEEDTSVTISVWLSGDYNTYRDLTVYFINRSDTKKGRLGYDEDSIDFALGVLGADTTTIAESLFSDKSAFVSALNSAFVTYASQVGCRPACMTKLSSTDEWATIFEKVNANLREDALDINLSAAMNAKRLNAALAKDILLFKDATLGTSTFSREVGVQADEPSVTISDDGGTMHLYAKKFAGRHYRFSTQDGVNWTESLVTLTGRISGTDTLMHPSVNYVNGVYYFIGVTGNTGGNLHLYTSTDGLNFAYQGDIFLDGHIVNTNASLVALDGTIKTGLTVDVNAWGNCYLIWMDGKFYLYYEFRDTSVTGIGWTNWQIALATCTDILHQNQDGTIGDWVEADNNPVLPYRKDNEESCGNADFASGADNGIVKSNGYYYIYYHGSSNDSADPEDSTKRRGMIYRAKSKDLQHWTKEGPCFDVRDIGTLGEYYSNVTDHCVTEFKGRTYMFYSWDINSTTDNPPELRYLIDDRPLCELLKLRP